MRLRFAEARQPSRRQPSFPRSRGRSDGAPPEPWRQTGDKFGNPAVAVPELDRCNARTAVRHQEDGPIAALPEQGADRNGERIVGAPDRDVDNDPVIVPKARPYFRWIDEVDRDADPLLLDAERTAAISTTAVASA